MPEPAKTLVVIGLILAAAGAMLAAFQKAGLQNPFAWVGHLPLDIRIEKDNFRFYFPIGTSIVLSILLSLVVALIKKLFP
ncbi:MULTISPECIES: DUF2905 domain-containing protein [Prosthecochloris]|uniref:DUF2905 domain-containing protein n=1 Tax=Prosthecochloris vibrioformis TaxID=1098 RepID=A0A5C4RXK1_PROVB|nr:MULTISPECIES: DUF2905 domain-containing protein [Prosthecochloris]ANT65222.1 hypothetical protein Ptc2401_01464 [Prosthecochloris sp. CIB 2401]TNJ36003.1 DUF2905 domain-containing protein [Prosthecochloris vibrioformis]